MLNWKLSSGDAGSSAPHVHILHGENKHWLCDRDAKTNLTQNYAIFLQLVCTT